MTAAQVLNAVFPDLPPPPPKFIMADDGESLSFAFHRIEKKVSRRHFLSFGQTGSGKTILLRLFLQSAVPTILREQSGVLVDDPKGDMPPMLAGMGLTPDIVPTYDLHYFREGSYAWDIAADIRSPGDIAQCAKLLIPHEANMARYFNDAARNVVRGVLLAFIEIAPSRWTLRDFLLATRSLDRLERLVSRSPEARGIAENHLQDKRHRGALMATLQATLASLDVLAALWASTPKDRQFSIREFLKNPGVVILGHDPRYEAVLDTPKALLLKFIAQHLLASSRPDVSPEAGASFYFILDEFLGLNDDGAISYLLNQARSKGVCVYLSLQSKEGLYAKTKKLGLPQEAADEILGLCDSVAVLKVSTETSEWAEKYFGKRRIEEESRSFSGGSSGSGWSESYSMQERSLFTASCFQGIPPISDGNFRVFTDVCGQIVIKNRNTAEVFGKLRPFDMRYARGERPISDQFLHEWSTEEENFWCPPKRANDSPGFRPSKPFRPSRPPNEKE